jgi:hypothetical protein
VNFAATKSTKRHALLQEALEPAVTALWLGHEPVETTQVYPDANLTLRQRAPGTSTDVVHMTMKIERTRPPKTCEREPRSHA